MPFIDSKITVAVAPEKKEILKAEFGQAISLLHKSENYLMVGLEDNYDLQQRFVRFMNASLAFRVRQYM